MGFKDISVTGETTTSTGNGALTVAGAIGDLRAFADALSDGDTVHVYIRGVSGDADGDWEECLATWASAGGTLTPTVCYANSNGNTTLIDWGTGTKQIMAVMPGWSDLDATGKGYITKILGLAPLTARGDMLRFGETAPERVALEAAGKVWASDGTDAGWLSIITALAAAADWPMFAAYPSSGPTMTSNTYVKITHNTEIVDIGSYFASNKWTPPAGHVLLLGLVMFGSTNGVDAEILYSTIYKNGSALTQGGTARSSIVGSQGAFTWYLGACNGTDYFEHYGKKSGTGNGNIQDGSGPITTIFGGLWLP